jgi:hypothetical protein
MPGSKEFQLTGSLGNVMQESARTALAYVRSRAEALGLEKDFFEKYDFHLHIQPARLRRMDHRQVLPLLQLGLSYFRQTC